MLSYSGQAQETAKTHLDAMLGYCVRLTELEQPLGGTPLESLDLAAGDYWVHSTFFVGNGACSGQLRVRLLPCQPYRHTRDGHPPQRVEEMPVSATVTVDPFEVHLIVY